MTKFLICTVLILTSVAKAASTGESCPACSSSNTFSHLNFFNEDASVKSPNGFMLGSGFKVNLKCAYACEQQPSVKEVTATSTFLPLRQKLIVGDGGVNPKQSLFMYGSMTARLSAWTGEVCMAAAEAACGGALQVATSEAKQARIGSQIFALPLGVRARHETVISPFVIGRPSCRNRNAGQRLWLIGKARRASSLPFQDTRHNGLRRLLVGRWHAPSLPGKTDGCGGQERSFLCRRFRK
jgi:hypothetical protein